MTEKLLSKLQLMTDLFPSFGPIAMVKTERTRLPNLDVTGGYYDKTNYDLNYSLSVVPGSINPHQALQELRNFVGPPL